MARARRPACAFWPPSSGPFPATPPSAVSKWWPAGKSARQIGFLSTGTALYGRLTARELVEYFGRLHGMSEDVLRPRLDALFPALEMNEFRDRRCDKLSTGMKQKVSIARTLVHDPPVMIFDEPTHGLDVLAARAVVGFIRECRARGKTVIFSTHVMSEMEKLCDTIAIIHQGRIMAEGRLAELREPSPARTWRTFSSAWWRHAMSRRNLGRGCIARNCANCCGPPHLDFHDRGAVIVMPLLMTGLA